MIKRFVSDHGIGTLWCLFFLVFSSPFPASAAGVYFVKEGDSVAGIAEIFGVDADRLLEANSLHHVDIKPGDRFRIPDKVPTPAQPRETTSHRHADSDRVLQAICRDETVYHTVARGDTLFAIARRYATELDDLLRLNALSKKSRLSIGQKVIVRRSGPRAYTVVRGDTVARIASRFGMTAADLVRLNRLDSDRIAPGQRLMIDPCDPYAVAGSAPPPLAEAETAGHETGASRATITESTLAAASPLEAGTAAGDAAISQRVIDLARTMLDIPYRFGGTTLRGIDCSAYVQRVFGLIDVRIPRTAREQFGVGARIVRGNLAVGDLVFFRTYASFPSHVGIYIGNNLFIHASSMVRKVTIDSLDQPYYRKRFLGARRVVTDESPALASAP